MEILSVKWNFTASSLSTAANFKASQHTQSKGIYNKNV